MKKIDYEKLGAFFAGKAIDEFGGWYSSETYDWEEEIRNAESNANYNENEDIYECHLEVSKVGKTPLLIDFYKKDITDENDNYIDSEYYI